MTACSTLGEIVGFSVAEKYSCGEAGDASALVSRAIHKQASPPASRPSWLTQPDD